MTETSYADAVVAGSRTTATELEAMKAALRHFETTPVSAPGREVHDRCAYAGHPEYGNPAAGRCYCGEVAYSQGHADAIERARVQLAAEAEASRARRGVIYGSCRSCPASWQACLYGEGCCAGCDHKAIPESAS